MREICFLTVLQAKQSIARLGAPAHASFNREQLLRSSPLLRVFLLCFRSRQIEGNSEQHSSLDLDLVISQDKDLFLVLVVETLRARTKSRNYCFAFASML
jgi:hypothetical protein